MAVYAAVHYLGVHAGAADVLPDLVQHQNIQIHRNTAHPGFRQRQQFLFALLHHFDGHCRELSGVVVRVFENCDPAQDFSGSQHLASHAVVRDGTTAFICGPPAMVAELPGALSSLGVTRDRIVTENW